MDKFLSDALLQGFDEVLIYHGIGTGKLSYAVKEFLKEHPSVKSFADAPAHMGGFGAKVVRL
jgi:DNA mismatch repair protein MutS2